MFDRGVEAMRDSYVNLESEIIFFAPSGVVSIADRVACYTEKSKIISSLSGVIEKVYRYLFSKKSEPFD